MIRIIRRRVVTPNDRRLDSEASVAGQGGLEESLDLSQRHDRILP